jgi:hypothetical protein
MLNVLFGGNGMELRWAFRRLDSEEDCFDGPLTRLTDSVAPDVGDVKFGLDGFIRTVEATVVARMDHSKAREGSTDGDGDGILYSRLWVPTNPDDALDSKTN